MGFNPPVPQQDSNWEIRVAVLLSLFLQVLLIFLGPVRKRSSSSRDRVIVWSCYLLADWVADLSLGLILNNMGNIGSGGGGGTASTTNPIIFAFWTPFLLLHLGGPDTITAYSVEDNELWIRHLIGLLFELFSACVIFLCTLRDNPLVPATVLMFVVGTIKYAERTYSLYFGSLESFRANILGPPVAGRNYAELLESPKNNHLELEVERNDDDDAAAAAVAEAEQRELLAVMDNKDMASQAYAFFTIFRRLFVDLVLSSKQRRMAQAFFMKCNAWQAFQIMELELGFIYDMVYTKAPVAYSKIGWILRCICSCCLVSALVIFFHFHHVHVNKQQQVHGGISRVDVRITYALLLGGVALDLVALATLLESDYAAVFLLESRRFIFKRLSRWSSRRTRQRHWSRTLSKFNLMEYCLGCGRGGRYNLLARLRVPPEIIQNFFIHYNIPLSEGITYFPSSRLHVQEDLLLEIFFEVKDVALLTLPQQQQQQSGHDLQAELEIQEEALNRRGKRTIERHGTKMKEFFGSDDNKFKVILDSVVKTDFDESLLLWHIATDLCRHRPNDEYVRPVAPGGTRPMGPPRKEAVEMQAIGECLSEYMLYLLVKQPEMLSARTGIWLMRYRDTCEDVRRFFDSTYDSTGKRRMLLLSVNTSEKPTTTAVNDDDSKSVLFDAIILAKALTELQDHDRDLMWEVVLGVWTEMLLYAARNCPGSTHVRHLNRGGELITIIWFIMEHMGLGNAYDAKNKKVDVPANADASSSSSTITTNNN